MMIKYALLFLLSVSTLLFFLYLTYAPTRLALLLAILNKNKIKSKSILPLQIRKLNLLSPDFRKVILPPDDKTIDVPSKTVD